MKKKIYTFIPVFIKKKILCEIYCNFDFEKIIHFEKYFNIESFDMTDVIISLCHDMVCLHNENNNGLHHKYFFTRNYDKYMKTYRTTIKKLLKHYKYDKFIIDNNKDYNFVFDMRI
jgi:hypothetical protein